MRYNAAQKFLLLAASILPAALGQTSSNCNPLKGCKKDDPALGGTFSYDYSQNHAAAPKFDVIASNNRITYESDGMHMRVQGHGDSPTIQSQFYIFWGKIEVVMKVAPGQGVISSLVYQSDDLDEIDVEFVGSQPGNVQTNIFSKGNQDVHIYGGNTPVDDAVGQFHSYVVDWTPTEITWYINGVSARVLTRASLGDVYPQTPMQIKFGPWAGGDPANPEGTRQWAGGDIDWNKGPYDMVVKSITVNDYSTGASLYRYKDNSGSSESIEIVGGGSTPQQKPTSSATPKPTPSPTSSSTSTSASAPAPTSTSKSTTSAAPTSSPKPTSTSSSEHSTRTKFTIVSDSTTSSQALSTGDSNHAVTPSSTLQTSAIKTTSSSAGGATTSAPSGNGASVMQISWSLLSLVAFTMLFL